MTRARDLDSDLAKARKKFKDIKKLLDSVYEDSSLKFGQIYKIIR